MMKSRMKKFIIDALNTSRLGEFYCQRGKDFIFGNGAFVVRLHDADLSQYYHDKEKVKQAEKVFAKVIEKHRAWNGAPMMPPSISRLKRLIKANECHAVVRYYFTVTNSYNARIMLPLMKLLGNCKMDFRQMPGYIHYGPHTGKFDEWALYLVGDRGEAVIMPYAWRSQQ